MSTATGCLSAEIVPGSDDDGSRHPFADTTQTVRIDNDSITDHDVESNARESLEFWEEHAEEYVGFGIEFEIVDHDDPDVIIAYADDPSGCEAVEEYSERVLGCAPLIRPGGQPRRPITARVVAGDRPFGKIRITTKHEIGHVLGLGHDDEPRWIMSDRPEDRIPLYDVRIDIWETVIGAQERGASGSREFNQGVAAWQERAYERAEGHFADAHAAYGGMRDMIAYAGDRTAEFDGHPRVETVNLTLLRQRLNQLYRRTTAAEWFSWHMADACRGALAGDRTAIDRSLERANEHVREYNEVGPIEIRDVAIALGLVRGFDRDDPVLDPEEDELADDVST